MTPRFPFSFKLSLLKIDLGFALLRIFQQGCASHWWPVEILLWAGCTENMNSRSSNIRLWLLDLDLDFWWMSIEMSIEHLMREDELWFLAVRGAARLRISGCSSRLPRSPVLARRPNRHHLLYGFSCVSVGRTLFTECLSGTPSSSLSVPRCFRQVWGSTRMWDDSWQDLVGGGWPVLVKWWTMSTWRADGWAGRSSPWKPVSETPTPSNSDVNKVSSQSTISRMSWRCQARAASPECSRELWICQLRPQAPHLIASPLHGKPRWVKNGEVWDCRAWSWNRKSLNSILR